MAKREKKESVEEFVARGGEVQRLPTGASDYATGVLKHGFTLQGLARGTDLSKIKIKPKVKPVDG